MKVIRVLVATILAACLSATAQAGPIILETPAGLAPGDHFRFVFVTDGTRGANSTSIADYNHFVNVQAAGALYNGLAVDWFAIASTSTVSAITNIGQTGDAIYLPDGTLVASNDENTGLWSGQLLSPIDMDLSSRVTSVITFTGTSTNGNASGELSLGNLLSAESGLSSASNSHWIQNGTRVAGVPAHFYAISQSLTVPATPLPEPGSFTLLSLALASLGAFRCMKRWMANAAA